MINGSIWPFHRKALLNKLGAFLVYGIHQILCVLFGLAARNEAVHLVFPRSIKKKAQRVFPVLQKLLRSTPHDHAIPSVRRVLDHAPGKSHDRLAVHKIQLVRIDAAFIASAQEGFKQPVIQRISSLFAHFDHGFGAIGQPGNFFRKPLVPQFPAETRRNFLRDFTAPASVFAFDRNGLDHMIRLLRALTWPFSASACRPRHRLTWLESFMLRTFVLNIKLSSPKIICALYGVLKDPSSTVVPASSPNLNIRAGQAAWMIRALVKFVSIIGCVRKPSSHLATTPPPRLLHH